MTKEKLLPARLLEQLPKLYETENLPDDKKMVVAKFFYPDFSWTWYAIEFDGEDTFFGLVDGFEKELGYFTLSELMENKGKLGLAIERDLNFKPVPLSTLTKGGCS